MAKDAYYSPHDYNAHWDPKIRQMMSIYGYAAYGMYWLLIENMRSEDGYTIPFNDIYVTGVALPGQAELLKNFILDAIFYGLFIKEGDRIYSQALINKMAPLENTRESMYKNSLKRWPNANAMHKKGVLRPKADENYKKDVFWFNHDSNAHNDPKIVGLMQEWGYAGYGIYWILIECMRAERDFKIPWDKGYLDAIALHGKQEQLKDVILYLAKVELVQFEDRILWSNTFIERMGVINELRENRSKTAIQGHINRRKRLEDANALQKNANALQVKVSKVKKSIIKKAQKKGNNEAHEKLKANPPTLSVVSDYVKEEKLVHVDPKFFLKFFIAADWVDTNGKPVLNWKLKTQSWHKMKADRLTATAAKAEPLDFKPGPL